MPRTKTKANQGKATAAQATPDITERAPPKASATTTPLAARTDFAEGDRVFVELRGNKRVTGVIVEVLKAHCQVKLDQDQGPLSGVKKRTAKKSIHMLTSVSLGPAPPAEESAAESADGPAPPADDVSAGSGDGGPAAAAEAPAAAAMEAAAAGEAAAAAKRSDASEVFGEF